MSRVWIVKWHPFHALPFLGPSTACYLHLPAVPGESVTLESDARLATLFQSRADAQRLRDRAERELSRWTMTSPTRAEPCDPGCLTVVPATLQDVEALGYWHNTTRESAPILSESGEQRGKAVVGGGQ
jgi:hypothetical protein